MDPDTSAKGLTVAVPMQKALKPGLPACTLHAGERCQAKRLPGSCESWCGNVWESHRLAVMPVQMSLAPGLAVLADEDSCLASGDMKPALTGCNA